MGREKAEQRRRRLTRRVEEVDALLKILPAPGGTQAEASVQLLDHLAASGPAIDWAAVHPACDPLTIIAAGSEVAVEDMDEATRLRASRKRWQVESFYLLLQLLGSNEQPHHIVDFGSGTGNLLLPLAALLPHCTFTSVEMKPAATGLLQQRAAEAGLSNVQVFRGMIEEYAQPFDVALALHACGNATDHVLLKAVERHAAYLVSPCCVGKLKFSMAGGSSFHRSVTTWFPQMPGDRPSDRPKVQQALEQQSLEQQALEQHSLEAAGQGKQPHTGGRQLGQQRQGPSELKAAGPEPAGQSQEPGKAPAGPRISGSCKRPRDDGDRVGVVEASGQHTAAATETAAEAAAAAAAAEAAAEAAKQQPPKKLQHPRSRWLMSALPDPERHFKLIAQIADSQSELEHLESELAIQRAAIAGTCKLHVELDRNEAAREAGYHVALAKVLQHSQMAKGDLLLGVPASWPTLGRLQQELRLSGP